MWRRYSSHSHPPALRFPEQGQETTGRVLVIPPLPISSEGLLPTGITGWVLTSPAKEATAVVKRLPGCRGRGYDRRKAVQ